MLEVTAAVIWQGEKVLICRRPTGKSRGLMWEFPGGKLEPGETAEQCILRECREELGVVLTPPQSLAVVCHRYPDVAVRLHFFAARIAGGVLTRKEHSAFAWAAPAELAGYALCPADAEMLAHTDLAAAMPPETGALTRWETRP